MNRSEVEVSAALDSYLSRLEAELTRVPSVDRREILLETRSHVLERTRRLPSRSVEEVLAELGSPHEYASRFLPEAEVTPTPTSGVLHTIARHAQRGRPALPLLMTVAAAYGVALFWVAVAALKLIAPDAVGVWMADVDGHLRPTFVGFTAGPSPKGEEVLGYALVPLALIISVTIHSAILAVLKRSSPHARDRRGERAIRP